MLLSKLIYLCVKNVVYVDDISFSYDEFLKGTFTNSSEYSTSILNVFSPLNEAIARLSDLDRIPYQIDALETNGKGEVLLSDLSNPVKEVINVARVYSANNYDKLEFMILGDKIKTNLSNTVIYIEYKIDIPMFDENDIPNEKLLGTKDVELKEYKITDSMCNYIIEYVKGNLGSVVGEDIANMHLTRAEQYFDNIRSAILTFNQSNVKARYTIE